MDGDRTHPRQPVGTMRRRRITLADGRYLIFYTFGEPGDTPGQEPSGRAENRSEEEERRV